MNNILMVMVGLLLGGVLTTIVGLYAVVFIVFGVSMGMIISHSLYSGYHYYKKDNNE